MFPRQEYYSQTEITKRYQISVKGIKQLILDQKIDVVTKDVNLGEYSVKALYIRKEDIDKLNLPTR